MSMRFLMKNWKVFAQCLPIDGGGSSLVHVIICYTCASALAHSQRRSPVVERTGTQTVAASLPEVSPVANRATATANESAHRLNCYFSSSFTSAKALTANS